MNLVSQNRVGMKELPMCKYAARVRAHVCVNIVTEVYKLTRAIIIMYRFIIINTYSLLGNQPNGSTTTQRPSQV